MALAEIGDPRLQALFGAEDPRESQVRPLVRVRPKGMPTPLLIAVAAVVAIALFLFLNSGRTAQPPTRGPIVEQSGATVFDAPAPLYVPPVAAPVVMPLPAPVQENAPAPTETPPSTVPASPPNMTPAPQPIYMPPPVLRMPPPPIPIQQPRRVSGGGPLVLDSGTGVPNAQSGPVSSVNDNLPRVRASAFANRSSTVAQGTLIPAVLETAFDSSQPGFARAIVARDVRSFDGSQVLVPRGSRLIGEYRTGTTKGQNRAGIIWNRLIRPDGMTIEMDSPATDTLGRGGVSASVDTHFWSRFGDALMQTVTGFGSFASQRALPGSVLVVPNEGAASAAPTGNYTPTLKVPAGKSISIFVARDLDFSAAESE